MASTHRSHGNEKRARLRHKCRAHLSSHIYEKLGIIVSPMNVRLKPGSDDPYRWVCVPSTEHLLRKQLSKGSTRDYQNICDAIDRSALEAVSVDQYMQREGLISVDSQQGKAGAQVSTEGLSNKLPESFAVRVVQLTAENEILLSAERMWKRRAEEAEAALASARNDLESERQIAKQLNKETQEYGERIRGSLDLILGLKNRVESSNQALQSLFEAIQASHNKLILPR